MAVVYLSLEFLAYQVSGNSQKWPQNIQFPAIGQTHPVDIVMEAGLLAGFGEMLKISSLNIG